MDARTIATIIDNHNGTSRIVCECGWQSIDFDIEDFDIVTQVQDSWMSHYTNIHLTN